MLKRFTYIAVSAYDLKKRNTGVSVLDSPTPPYVSRIVASSDNVTVSNLTFTLQDIQPPTFSTTEYLTTTYAYVNYNDMDFEGVDSELE